MKCAGEWKFVEEVLGTVFVDCEKLGEALFDFAGGVVGECQDENVVEVEFAAGDPGGANDQGAGFARASAGEQENAVVGVGGDGVELFGSETGEDVAFEVAVVPGGKGHSAVSLVGGEAGPRGRRRSTPVGWATMRRAARWRRVLPSLSAVW